MDTWPFVFLSTVNDAAVRMGIDVPARVPGFTSLGTCPAALLGHMMILLPFFFFLDREREREREREKRERMSSRLHAVPQ